MGLIVKPGDAPPPPSLSKSHISSRELVRRQEQVRKVIQKFDDEKLWDQINARDVPEEMIDYVNEMIKCGFDQEQIRRQLGVTALSKAWKKISSALKQGFRVDGTAFLLKLYQDHVNMSEKLKSQIMKAFDDGIEVPTKNGTEIIRGPSKELAMTIDTYNRLQQGFIKNAKDLGAYVEPEKSGGQGGVTIVVQTNVPSPNIKDVEAHHEKIREKNKQAIEAYASGQSEAEVSES